MGPLDDIYTITYSKEPSTAGHTSVYDGSKWVATPTTVPKGTSWTGSSTSSTPPAWSLPKVDMLQSIEDPRLRNAIEDIIYADKNTSAEISIEHINSAIKLLSKKVIEMLGEE